MPVVVLTVIFLDSCVCLFFLSSFLFSSFTSCSQNQIVMMMFKKKKNSCNSFFFNVQVLPKMTYCDLVKTSDGVLR